MVTLVCLGRFAEKSIELCRKYGIFSSEDLKYCIHYNKSTVVTSAFPSKVNHHTIFNFKVLQIQSCSCKSCKQENSYNLQHCMEGMKCFRKYGILSDEHFKDCGEVELSDKIAVDYHHRDVFFIVCT